jgi:hypothetical protein
MDNDTLDLDIRKDTRHWKSASKTNKTVCLTNDNKPCLENGRLLKTNGKKIFCEKVIKNKST